MNRRVHSETIAYICCCSITVASSRVPAALLQGRIKLLVLRRSRLQCAPLLLLWWRRKMGLTAAAALRHENLGSSLHVGLPLLLPHSRRRRAVHSKAGGTSALLKCTSFHLLVALFAGLVGVKGLSVFPKSSGALKLETSFHLVLT